MLDSPEEEDRILQTGCICWPATLVKKIWSTSFFNAVGAALNILGHVAIFQDLHNIFDYFDKCLLLWTSINITCSLILLIAFYASDIFNLTNPVYIISFITVIVNISVCVFLFIGTYFKNAKLLRIGLFSIVFNTIYILLALITEVMFMTDMFGSKAVKLVDGSQLILVVVLMIIYSGILLIVQVFLGWTVRLAWNEVTISKTVTQL